jgi:tetratricopeptide (TPR) repeat protein
MNEGSQPIHRDASLLTLQVALSPSADFTAGGTYFEAIKDTVVMEAGHALCHSSGKGLLERLRMKFRLALISPILSGIMHAGKAIDSGDRWVMVFFVLSDEEIQVAKRCHAAGVSKMDEGDHTLAESYFRSGLEASPTDHLLHNSLANCYFVQGENAKGREQLRLAQSYKPCSKALLLHANTLMMLSRPRAALRRLEQALNDIDGSDTLPGAWTPLKALAWECRVQAGRAACLCAEKERESAGPGDNLKWSKTQLPAAMQRMRIALTAAPEHGPLRGMLARAEELYTMANASSAE